MQRKANNTISVQSLLNKQSELKKAENEIFYLYKEKFLSGSSNR